MNKPGTVRVVAGWAVVVAVAVLVGWASDSPAKDDKPGDAPDANAPAVAAPDFSGKYLADGIGNGGRPYRAMVEIRREGDMYNVIWVLGPRETYSGVGLAEGDALCVGWASGGTPGVIVYESQKGKLVGRWTAPGAEGKTFKENLTPVK